MKTDINLNRLKIGYTDVILENFETGRGKIIVSDLGHGSYSHFWGAMGQDIESFLLTVDADYFAMKLLPYEKQSVFCSESTVKAIRKYLREDFQYELPWYKYLTAQKEMRAELKNLEQASSEHEFVDMCHNFTDNILCFNLDYSEELEFKKIIRGVFEDEPWNFIQKKPSREYKFMCELIKSIKTELQK